MRKSTFIATGLILMSAVCLVAWMTTRRATPLTIVVSFSGYTNDASGVSSAVFNITNKSEVKIRRWGVYHVEVQGDAQRRGPLFYGRNAFIAPGEFATFAVPAYTNGTPWRVGLHCSRDDWRRSFSDFAGGLPPSVERFVPRRLRGTPVDLAWSNWIER